MPAYFNKIDWLTGCWCVCFNCLELGRRNDDDGLQHGREPQAFEQGAEHVRTRGLLPGPAAALESRGLPGLSGGKQRRGLQEIILKQATTRQRRFPQ